MDWVWMLGACIVLGIASYTDIRDGIIPNWLVFPAIGIAAFYRYMEGNSFDYFAGGIFIFLALLIMQMVLKTLGGGDVKLFTFLGLVVGYPTIMYIVLGAYLIPILLRKTGWVKLAPYITASYLIMTGVQFFVLD